MVAKKMKKLSERAQRLLAITVEHTRYDGECPRGWYVPTSADSIVGERCVLFEEYIHTNGNESNSMKALAARGLIEKMPKSSLDHHWRCTEDGRLEYERMRAEIGASK